MGACACGGRTSYESYYNEFFSHMVIRKKSIVDYKEMVKIHISKGSVTDKKMLQLVDKILKNEEHNEISVQFWTNAKKQKETEQRTLFLAILFLCAKNKDEARKAFKELSSICFGQKIKFEEKNGSIHVEKQFLLDIVQFYIKLVSQIAILHLSRLATSKLEFENYSQSIFSDRVINKYMDDLFSRYNRIDVIDLNEFFEFYYENLADDTKVRSDLENAYQSTIKNDLRSPSTTVNTTIA
jgi:hypothetical protein